MQNTPERTVLRLPYTPEMYGRILGYGKQIPRGVSIEVRQLLEGLGIFCGSDDIVVQRTHVEVAVAAPVNHFDEETLADMGRGLYEQKPFFLSAQGIRAQAERRQDSEERGND